MNRLEEYGYASLYKALKHKYKYTLSTNLPCVSRRSQFLALLCIFPELLSLQESCHSRFRLSSRLFGCLKCLLLLIFRHILEIINDHPSLVVKVAKSFCKDTKYCSAKSKFRYLLSVEFRGGSRLMQLMQMHQSEFFELRILKKISMLIINN